MWATTVAPVSARNSRVKWLWDRPTDAAISGTEIGAGRCCSM